MKQVPYPEEGDEVFLKNGNSGYVSSESPVSQDEGDWQVEVENITDIEGEELADEEERTQADVEVTWSEEKKGWVES